jgi:drug/metabolite transporter (DMT)-like permease
VTIPTKARLALACVCFFWGTTYFAIRLAVKDLPPAMFCAVRFLLAGVPLLLYELRRGRPLPHGREWRTMGVTALLLLCAGNGLLAWAEQWVPTGIASLLIVTTPLWMALFAARSGERIRPRTAAGLALGFVGVLAILETGQASTGRQFLLACAGLLLSSVTWAYGSVYSKRHPTRASPLMTAAIQMLIGCALFAVIALVDGEPARWNASLENWLAIAYLAVFGSIVGYGCYLYALAHLPTAQASLYAYVNPLVAVLLGAAFLGERVGPRVLVGAPLILGGVFLVSSRGRGARATTSSSSSGDESRTSNSSTVKTACAPAQPTKTR